MSLTPALPRLDGGDPVARARELVPLIRECADEAERERHLPQRAAEALARAGLHRVAAPRSLGGAECEPEVQIETIDVKDERPLAFGDWPVADITADVLERFKEARLASGGGKIAINRNLPKHHSIRTQFGG